MRFTKLIAFLLITTAAGADVTFTREYSFPPSQWEELEKNLKRASERPADQQEYPVAFSLKEGISLWCPPHQPNAAGIGCDLIFNSPGGAFRTTLRKPLAPEFSHRTVTEKLSKIDPNSTSDHLHFGSPFPKPAADGSHYYCEPKGDAGNKTWDCTLYVQESWKR